MKQYTSSANWPEADPRRLLSDAALGLADYLFTHPNPPGWPVVARAAARGTDEFCFALIAWMTVVREQPVAFPTATAPGDIEDLLQRLFAEILRQQREQL